jgi:hypothetical protein
MSILKKTMHPNCTILSGDCDGCTIEHLRSENSQLSARLERAESILGHVHRSYGVRASETGWYPCFMVGDFLAEKTPQEPPTDPVVSENTDEPEAQCCSYPDVYSRHHYERDELKSGFGYCSECRAAWKLDVKGKKWNRVISADDAKFLREMGKKRPSDTT